MLSSSLPFSIDSLEPLTFYYQNVRGLRTKIADFRSVVLLVKHDILCLTETWLSSDVGDAELIPNDYSAYRADRDLRLSGKCRGGGVAVCVSNKTHHQLLSSFSGHYIEEIAVLIWTQPSPLIVYCVYIPPRTPVEAFESHLLRLEELYLAHPDYNLLICGDYNLPSVKWTSNSDSRGTIASILGESQQARAVVDTYSWCGLVQYNEVKNHQGTMLDLVFCNRPLTLDACTSPLTRVDDYHPPLLSSLDFLRLIDVVDESQYYRDFRNATYASIVDYLESMDWGLMHGMSIDEAAGFLNDVINISVDAYVPWRRRVVSTFPSWFSSDLTTAIFKKKSAHKRYKQSGNYSDYQDFAGWRNRCKELLGRDKANHINRLENNIVQSPRDFYRYFGERRPGRQSFVRNVSYNGNDSHSALEAAELFGSYFASTFCHPRESMPGYAAGGFMGINDVTEEKVLKMLLDLDPRKSAGADHIAPTFVKSAAIGLVVPLTIIFNKSLKSGTVPSTWKITNVIPIFKKGDKRDVSNYRPISIQSVFPKLLDRFVSGELMHLVRSKINIHQHGFFPTRSINTNLFNFVTYIYDAFERGLVVDAIYADFAKAFDTVDHSILLRKLGDFDLPSGLLAWIRGFLVGRRQQVIIDTCLSSLCEVTSGVPQGSHMGPLLFLLFINDIGINFTGRYLLYADDLKLFSVVADDDDLLRLQGDIDALVDWCEINNLRLNVQKCSYIRFQRSRIRAPKLFNYNITGTPLSRLDCVTDLGVIFTHDMTPLLHLENVSGRALQMLGFIRRSSMDVINVRCLVLLYVCFVRSIMEFAIIIWFPYYSKHVEMLERVQKVFVKFLCHRFRVRYQSSEYRHLLEYFGLSAMTKRRNVHMLHFVHGIVTGRTDAPDLLEMFAFSVPGRSTRQVQLLKPFFRRTTQGAGSPMVVATELVNRLHLDNCMFSTPLRVLDRQICNS